MGERRGRSVSSDTGSSIYFSCDEELSDEMSAPRLNVLKTKAESRALAETIKVWIVELPVKAANDILIICKDQIPDSDSVDLQHLRRFAKANLLPPYLQPSGSRASSTDSRYSTASSSSTGTKSSSRSRSRMRKRRNSAASTLHLLICPTDVISQADLSSLMMKQPPFAQDGFPLRLREITVPLLAPTSVEQAQQWTAQYWPTLYRKTNPFGPHPSLVARSEEEIRDEASKYMMLARQAAAESSSRQFGIGAGCVIVERKADRHAEIVAVAGDARLSGLGDSINPLSQCSGNIACHAAMRGIGMVARKRVRVASPKTPKDNADIDADELLVKPVHHVKDTPESVSASLLDYPLTDLEQEAFDQDNLIANGYLCVDLEIYMTHEPCLMCSMAIVHSRFSRCIFGTRMPSSGGMAGDSGLGYGLFWRSELNWKLLCWEYTASKGQEMAVLKEDTQV
ncbi:cytidine deaminase-like protein [Myriangium duriaei CBS 260.36]|uniref:Cytidine deaminase-like protein n=1 Tax=Myriangium duriaei CBS 260.36 TaxID=1168546 RepID=A0A9P4MK00_9PEZI|nr:cytidine deaminase-like protein [Myriangium duriaei CBS 260.36]